MYALLTAGTHSVVEWDEPGCPRNVVARKNISHLESSNSEIPSVGDLCRVKIQEGGKAVFYNAKLLGCGKKTS